ncbi:hypothetical protein ABIF68_003944 [Bradyrhizobium japonicum]
MSNASWGSFEDKVRAVAGSIWNGKCEPQNIGGVDVDGVMILSKDAQIFVEMTVRRELDKVREDINKLQLARTAYLSTNNSFPRCYCVVNGAITRAMKDAGAALNIQVLSFDEFANIFFDFPKYSHARLAMAFGSAINPLTGARYDRAYVPVSYLTEDSSKELSIDDIAEMLRSGKKIVLLGEYGTGKSRCSRELFSHLAGTASASNLYPLALDLREFWGLKRAPELITRHMSDLGLEQSLQTAAVRARESSLDSVARLLWLLSLNVQRVERVLKLVRYFHAPIVPRPQLSVHVLKHLPGRDGGLLPGGVLVRELLSHVIDLGVLVRNVEEVLGHDQ